MTNARDLSNRLVELLGREQHAMADFLLALAEFDRLRAWEQLGHASIFAFLRRELGLSAGAAQYRKTAAELLQRQPEVEAALRSGKLCLSSICELAKVLTAENVADVLPRFYGLSRREAVDVAVSLRPVEHRPTREVVTAVRLAAVAESRVTDVSGLGVTHVSGPAPAGPPAEVAPSLPSREVRPGEPTLIAGQPKAPRSDAAGSPAAPTAAPKPSTVEPLDAAHARLHLTVSRRLLAKLEAAKEALSHARPGATTEEILEAALDLLLERSAKRKAAATKVPRAARAKQAAVKVPRTPPAKEAAPSDAAIEGDAAGPDQPAGRESRYVPAAVRREVWARDQGRCQWPLESGGICGSRHRLELDHATPVALGGPSTTGNVRVLCERHNKLAARQVFGEAWMARFRRDRTPSLPADHRREERP